MALKFVRGKTFPIGVDLGSSTVKMAQLRLEDDQLELLAAASAEVPLRIRETPAKRNGFLAQALRKMLRAAPFKGRRCVLSLPAEATSVQHAKLPAMGAEEMDAALRHELQGKLPYPVEDAVIRYVVAGNVYSESADRQEVIAICASRETLSDYLGVARRAKLDVAGVNVASCAIIECFSRLFRRTSDSARAILYIDMGATTTQVVFAHGRSMVFSRDLDIGAEQLDQSISKALNVPCEEARAIRMDLARGQIDPSTEKELHHLMDQKLESLASELTKCLRYHEAVFRGKAVERAIFVGGGAYDKRLCQSLAQRLNLPAQIGDPLVRVSRAEGAGGGPGMDRREPQPDWAVAVGLSLGAGVAA